MTHRTRKIRRGHPFFPGGLLAPPAEAIEDWLTTGNVAELVDFYSAQWSHLAALEDAERWQRSVPARPAETRAAELRELFHRLQEAQPPESVLQTLQMNLDHTLRLAEAFTAGGNSSRSDKSLLGDIDAHQRALETTRVGLLDALPGVEAPSGTMLAALKAVG